MFISLSCHVDSADVLLAVRIWMFARHGIGDLWNVI